MIAGAFDLSEEMGLPVVVRETRDFTRESGILPPLSRASPRRSGFSSQGLRWVSLPFNVVANHRRLHQRLGDVAARFEGSPFNSVEGRGPVGAVAAGFAHGKLLQALPEGIPSDMGLLKLGTIYPLPEELLVGFMVDKRNVLVVEETEPFVEMRLRALAQRRGLALDIQGKQTGHLPREGALATNQIRAAIGQLQREPLPPLAGADRTPPRPSQQGLCEGCFYIPLFEALRDTLAEVGLRGVVCADPGCGIRIHLAPFEMLDVKHCMGSAIGLASGLWLAGVEAVPIALLGDSSFFHTGLNGLLSAVSSGAHIFVLILDNGSAALTGAQPHPGSGRDARGDPSPAVQLERVLRACGVDHLTTIDPADHPSTVSALRHAMLAQGLRVVIARGECVRASQS
jgi:indolepyruvate ferredoxin oxidoreductase alpha subunit